MELTLEWLPSTKNSASVLPSPESIGGALNSSKIPPSPCDWVSNESLRPFSANILIPSEAFWSRRYKIYDLLCDRPECKNFNKIYRSCYHNQDSPVTYNDNGCSFANFVQVNEWWNMKVVKLYCFDLLLYLTRSLNNFSIKLKVKGCPRQEIF